MSLSLTGKVCLVTGASRGIGRAIGVQLGQEGATVPAAGRDKAALRETVQLVETARGQAKPYVVDLSEAEAVVDLADSVKREYGRLDVLVNNAGITLSQSLEETTNAQFDELMAVNARAAFILIRETIGLLKQADPGYIINISSVVGVKGYAQQIAYTASKHALRGMSIALAEELRSENVRIHVICPGGVGTEMVSRVRPDINKAELIGADEVAEVVRYLVTHQGNAVMDEIHLRRKTAAPWF